MPDIWLDVDVALAEVPVNLLPLVDDTDMKTRETAVAYNASGMDLVWNFVTPGGAFTQTAVTPTSAGAYDWTHQGDGMYTIEIPASGGASINNDTEGFGWFTGFVTGVLPWRGPVIGFRAAGLNDALIESAYSTTRGLAGTALPNAAADAAGGLPISDAGGLDLDAQIGTDIDAILVDTGTTLQAELDGIQADTEDIQTQIGAAGAGLTAVPWNASWDAEVQSEVADALDAALPGTPTSGSINDRIKTNLDAPISTVDTVVDAIKVVTDALPDSGALTSLATQASVDTIDNFLDTEIAAILAAVDTEVAAILALLDDARGEPGQGAPPVNPDLATKVDYLYKFARNKLTQTADTLSVYADDGTTVDHKSTVSDDGSTYTRGEFISGA